MAQTLVEYTLFSNTFLNKIFHKHDHTLGYKEGSAIFK